MLILTQEQILAMSLKQVEVTYNSIKQNLIVTTPAVEEWLRLRLNNLLHNGKDGLDGQDGINGINGAKGDQGLSAYEIALNNGFVGTEVEWLDSLKGDSGAGGGSFSGNTLIDWVPSIPGEISAINFEDANYIFPGTITTNTSISTDNNAVELEENDINIIGIDYNNLSNIVGSFRVNTLTSNTILGILIGEHPAINLFNPVGNFYLIVKEGPSIYIVDQTYSWQLVINEEIIVENILIEFTAEDVTIYKNVDNEDIFVLSFPNNVKTISLITGNYAAYSDTITFTHDLESQANLLNVADLTPGTILKPTSNFENISKDKEYLVLANNSLYELKDKSVTYYDDVEYNFNGSVIDIAITLPTGTSHDYIGYFKSSVYSGNDLGLFTKSKFRNKIKFLIGTGLYINNLYYSTDTIVESIIPEGDEVWDWKVVNYNFKQLKIEDHRLTLAYDKILVADGAFTSYGYYVDGVYNTFALYNWSIKDLNPNFATVAMTGSYNSLIEVPNFSTVAFSGNYNDLVNRPVLGNTSDIYLEHNSFRLNAQNQIENSRGLVVPFNYSSLTLGSGSFYGDRYFVLSERIIDFRALPQQARRQHQVFIRDSFLMFHVYGINFTVGLTLNTNQSLRSSVTIQNGSPPLLDGNINFLNPVTYLPVTENIISAQMSYIIIYENTTIKLYSKHIASYTNNPVSTALSTYTYVGYFNYGWYPFGNHQDDYLNFYISSPTSSNFIFSIINKTYKI